MAVTTQEKKYASAHPDEKTGLGKKIMNLSGQGLVYTILIVGAILFTAPWVWMISASFQPRGDMFNWPPTWWPEHFTLKNYQNFLDAAGIARWFLNSAIIAFSVVGLQVFFNSLAAYTFAKRNFPGRDAIFIFGDFMIEF